VDWHDEALFDRLVQKRGHVDAVRPDEATRTQDFHDLDLARAFARKKGGDVYERANLRDVTPDGDPPGILWGWDTREAR
jgi:hypothetical protein